MLFIALSLTGYVSYKQLQVEMLPNAELPLLYIQVSSRSDVDPNYMESQVIIPIEGAVSTIEGIEALESTAGTRSGSVQVDFNKSVNLKYTTLKIQQKINEILPTLPEGVTVNVQKVNVSGVSNNFMTLQVRGSGGVDRIRALVDENLKPKLENIDGVAAVNVYGGRQKTIEIRVNQEALEALNITSSQISSALSQYNQQRTFLGYIKEPDLRYYVHLDANYGHISEIENVIVANGPIYLKDLAKITFDLKDEETISRVNGKEAISVSLVNDAQVNLIELSERTRAEIDRLNKEFAADDVQMVVQSDSSEEISKNIDQIVNMAISGGLLAILVLWFFLRNIRLVTFIALSIPISVMSAFNLFYAFGITINSLTLIGIALAIGMLVDNSVVVLENIYRLSSRGFTPEKAVTQGTKEVWRSIFASTLTTITVFLPFVFSDEALIRLLGEHIGVSIISTLIFSLLVSLLFIPMTTYVILKSNKGKSVFYEKLSITERPVQIYTVLLKTSLRNPGYTISGAVVILILTLMMALSINNDTNRQVSSNRINVNVTMPTGSTLDNTDNLIKLMEARLDSFPEKEDVICRVQEDQASINITLKEEYEKIAGRPISTILSDVISRVNFNENVYVRVSAGSSGNSGNSASSAMNGFMSLLGIGDNSEKIIVKGSDYETMVLVANDIRYQLQQKEFISSSNTTFSGRQREIQLGFDPILLSSYDISRQNITAGLNSLNKELSTGTTLKLGEDEYDIVIKDDITEEEEKKLEQQRNKTVDDLRQVMIPDANSGLHQLQQIAKVKYSRGTAEVIRVNRDREITVSYYITQSEDLPKDILKGYQDEVDQLVEDYNLPAGIALQVDREKESMGEFEFLIIASLILIFMILASVFESVITPFVLMFSIPLAAIGSLLALVITGNSLLNANTMIGLLILLGVVVNNGIILIDYANILRSRGYTRNRAMITSGFARMRPILITSITTCIALLPMAMGDDEYAGAIGAPFAITVIGGLSFSALLTLVLVPTVYISMENIIKWYKELNHAIHLLHLALFGAGIFYIWARVDGIFYQLLHFMLLVTLIPGVTYFIRTTVRLANKKVISEDEPIVITIRNLVKIYDWPHLFIRQWQSGLQLRERLGLAKKYQRLFDFAGILWQVVFFGFTGYLAIVYLDSRTWIFFMSVTTCAGCLSLWTKLRQYLYFLAGANNKIVHYIDRTLYFGFPVLTVYLLFKRMDNMPLCITIAILWALGILIRQISNYLYDNEINVERLTGRFADTRRTFYTIIKSIPVIGKRRIPFKALRGVSFEIQTGMFGLLGPNGAGKSTLMRIVTGILEQSYGTIWINGMDTKKYREELQSLIGFLPQEFGTYETMSAWNYLDYQAILKGLMDSKVRSERLEYVLKAVHMYEKKDAKINSFSGGMKQRIGIALILLHLPRILVVDEPTAGLDPRERIRFRNLLVELSRDRIVIFSTHIIEDIASSCNQVAVINKGELKYYGKPTDMIYLAQNKVWTFDITPELFETLDPRLIVNHMQDGDMVSVRYISTEAPQANAVRTEPNLEDAYLCLLKNL